MANIVGANFILFPVELKQDVTETNVKFWICFSKEEKMLNPMKSSQRFLGSKFKMYCTLSKFCGLL